MACEPSSDKSLLEYFSDPQRRSLFFLLQDQTSSMRVRALATRLAAAEQEQSLVDTTQKEGHHIITELVHRHLPKLEEAGLIRWNQDASTVTVTDHLAFADPTLSQMLAVDAPDWDAVLDVLAHPRRCVILSSLCDEGIIQRADLAKAVLAREHGTITDHSTTSMDDILLSLHHIHLPMLDQAGLLKYQVDEGAAVYVGHPDLKEEWIKEWSDPRFSTPV